MKLFIIGIVAIIYSVTLEAQNNDIFKRRLWEEYKQKRLLQDTFNRVFSLPPATKITPFKADPNVMKLPLKGVFLKENSNGDKIYAMESDKMPCLVPGKNTVFNMPVAGIEKNNPDINPFPDNNSEMDRDKQNK